MQESKRASQNVRQVSIGFSHIELCEMRFPQSFTRLQAQAGEPSVVEAPLETRCRMLLCYEVHSERHNLLETVLAVVGRVQQLFSIS